MTTNQLAGNAVRRPSEGSNQGNTSSIVLKESNVRSAVYRSKKAPFQGAFFVFIINSETPINDLNHIHNRY